jgi:exopolyphosphatase/guanosine-5'-triphosphate,3'-diphosphate pyrophosphatase
VRTLARVHLAAGRRRRSGTHGYILGQGDLAVLSQRLRAVSLARRRRVPGLKPRRADIIVAGAVVLEELMRSGGYRTLTVC